MIKLNTTESINTVALAYLDDITEELKEVEGSDLRIGVSSFSSTKQRLYLIGDYIYNYSINVICEPVEGYEIKVDMGKKHTKDLSTLTNSVTGNFTASTYKFSNAIPINIYINSKTLTERTLDLIIKIIIGELNLEISCVGATISTNCMEFTGKWNVELNGISVLDNASQEDIYNYFDTHPDFYIELCETSTGADYAYLSAPLENLNVDIFIDNEWVRINDSSEENDIRENLKNNGIGIFNTYDSYGCFDLYRFQNMTSTDKTIRLSMLEDWWNQNGITILTPQENTTIISSDPFEEMGYRTVEVTLAKDSTFVTEKYIDGFSPRHNLRFFQTNSQTGEVYKYKFKVDNTIVNNPSGGDTFSLVTQNDLDRLTEALNNIGIRSNWRFEDNNVFTEFECLTTGHYKTLTVTQTANDININEYIDFGYTDNASKLIDKSSNNYELEYYLYDPIDLEYGDT